MQPRSRRFVGLAIAVALGYFFFLQTRDGWVSYWLRTDGQQGIAKITADYWGGHGQVVYYYDVNQKHYTGISGKNWRDPHYGDVRPGSEAVVYYSASHPWLSALYIPDTVVPGLPVLVIAFLIEMIAVVTIINPGSKWAFNLSDKKQNKNAA
jgi:hypothetical protein